MARPTTPPTARSSSTSDGGTVPPCGSARARSGVVTCARGVETTVPFTLDMLDYALGEGGGRDLGGVGHQAGQVVGDASRLERALEPAHDRRRDVRPPQLLEHHRPRQDHTPGIHLVEPGSVILSGARSEEHTSELQSLAYLVCRLLLEKKKNRKS